MAEPTYTESFIRLHATPQSYERGVAYYYDGSVLSMERRGDELVGQVEGSQYEPYQVRITFTGDAVESAFCDCPYEWGGWCKHVVAVLMAALHEPATVKERPTLGSHKSTANKRKDDVEENGGKACLWQRAGMF